MVVTETTETKASETETSAETETEMKTEDTSKRLPTSSRAGHDPRTGDYLAALAKDPDFAEKWINCCGVMVRPETFSRAIFTATTASEIGYTRSLILSFMRRTTPYRTMSEHRSTTAITGLSRTFTATGDMTPSTNISIMKQAT